MTTDKNKINFNNWYNKIFLKKHGSVSLPLFYSYTFEMQIGVYLSYYDSLGFVILIDYHNLSGQFSYAIDRKGYDVWFNSRNEAYKEAFKQSNEQLNQQLNNK